MALHTGGVGEVAVPWADDQMMPQAAASATAAHSSWEPVWDSGSPSRELSLPRWPLSAMGWGGQEALGGLLFWGSGKGGPIEGFRRWGQVGIGVRAAGLGLRDEERKSGARRLPAVRAQLWETTCVTPRVGESAGGPGGCGASMGAWVTASVKDRMIQLLGRGLCQSAITVSQTSPNSVAHNKHLSLQVSLWVSWAVLVFLGHQGPPRSGRRLC